MANPYRYAKTRHTRTETPPIYGRYQQYKPHLQKEFAGQCVYCRAIDHVVGSDYFGVDHYRPKSNPIFAALETEYLNLYYACNRCNRLKSNFWPTAAELRAERFIPNPCEHVMFDHLRYQRGEVVPHSSAGDYTVQRLDLNTKPAVEYRSSLITHLARTAADLAQAEKFLEAAEAQHRTAETPQQKSDAQDAVKLATLTVDACRQLLEQSIGPLALATATKQ